MVLGCVTSPFSSSRAKCTSSRTHRLSRLRGVRTRWRQRRPSESQSTKSAPMSCARDSRCAHSAGLRTQRVVDVYATYIWKVLRVRIGALLTKQVTSSPRNTALHTNASHDGSLTSEGICSAGLASAPSRRLWIPRVCHVKPHVHALSAMQKPAVCRPHPLPARDC
jgi:hypothetical protein